MMSRYHDDRTVASDPGGIRLDDAKLQRLHPELYTIRARVFSWMPVIGLFVGAKRRDMLAEHLELGDSRAAMVIRTEPLLVAAYTDELDCVAMLRFPDWLVGEYSLQKHFRLLTVNSYTAIVPPILRPAADLKPGPGNLGNWGNFYPVVADFLTRDRDRLEARKNEIGEAEWTRTKALGEEWMREQGEKARDGRPLRSRRPARGVTGIRAYA